MHVRNDNVTAVSGPDGEEIKGENGIFDVPAELGDWLIRVHGFVAHHIVEPLEAEVAKVTKPRTTRAKKTTQKPAEDQKPSTDETPAENANAAGEGEQPTE